MSRNRGGRWVAIAVGAFAVLGIGTLVGLVVGKRLKAATWSAPTGDDLVRIARSAEEEPPRVVYLHRGPITLTGGEDDAERRTSSVVASRGSDRVVKLRGFRGTTKDWRLITRCVGNLFAPFDILVTDVEPKPGTSYVMAVVGGRPKDVGHPKRVGGLAPFNGQVVPSAVVFAFADEFRNHIRATCEVIGMEVAHSFGLDHAYACPDVMSYLQGCGKKLFRDLDARCGESEARSCHDGAETQNSYRHLMTLLGPRKAGAAATQRID